MQTEFIFDGKKYISAKSASLLTGYTSDYIGQLCRASKIDSRRVGRIWFVAEGAILNYEKNVRSHEGAPEIVSEKQKQTLTSAHAHPAYSSKPVETSSKVSEFFAPRGITLSVPKISPAGLMIIAGVFTAILLAIVVTPDQFSSSSISKTSKIESVRNSQIELSKVEVTRTPSGMAASIDPSTQTGLVANIVMPIVGLVNRIALIEYAVLTSMVGGDPFCDSSNDYCMSGGSYKGLVVVSSTGNESSDTRVKTTVQDNFSDEVKIWSDEQGVSGVIEPVFKKETKDKYMYVVVPVKK